MEAIDGCLLALTLGATFVARSFSGDKAQLVPILKAGLAHKRLRVHRRHLAVRDVQRPRRLDQELRLHPRAERRGRAGRLRAAGRRRSPPTTSRAPCSSVMLHDGSWVRLRKVAEDYDPTDRDRAYAYIRERQKEGEVVTGLLYLSPDSSDVHEQNDTVATPLTQLPLRAAVPGQRRAGEAAGALPVDLFGRRSLSRCLRCPRRLRRAGASRQDETTTRRHDVRKILVSHFDGLLPAGGAALRAVQE